MPSLGLLHAICSTGWIWRKIHQRRWLRDADLAAAELPQKRELLGLPPTSSSPEVNTGRSTKKADLVWFKLKLPIFGWILKGRRSSRAYYLARSALSTELQCFAGGAVERRRQAGCDTAVLSASFAKLLKKSQFVLHSSARTLLCCSKATKSRSAFLCKI